VGAAATVPTVLGTLKALVQAGLVVSVEEEREKALEDLETRKRREEVKLNTKH
jgi:hypothetical protein